MFPFESWHDDLPTLRSLDKEVSRCFNMWSRQSDKADLPDTTMKFFPNIRMFLVLAYTLHVTSAEAERSFSVLRLIKSHLRSLIADTRFAALALLKRHYHKHTD